MGDAAHGASTQFRAVLGQRLKFGTRSSQSVGNSAAGSGGAYNKFRIRGGHRPGERKTRGAHQKEQFTSPEQNVQQTSALKIGQRFGMQGDIEGFPGAFLNEFPHIGQVHGLHLEPAAPRIERLKICVTTRQEVVQAESLLIQ